MTVPEQFKLSDEAETFLKFLAMRGNAGPSKFGFQCQFEGFGPIRSFAGLLQLRVLRFRLLQDWNVRVSIFPKREEILISGEGPGAGDIGVRSLRSS